MGYNVEHQNTDLSTLSGLNLLPGLLYVLIVSLNTAIPVRFSADITARLKTVSENSGIPISHLIRIATEQYLEKIESSRAVTIPLRGTAPTHHAKRNSNGNHS
jgi:hypothetical protein